MLQPQFGATGKADETCAVVASGSVCDLASLDGGCRAHVYHGHLSRCKTWPSCLGPPCRHDKYASQLLTSKELPSIKTLADLQCVNERSLLALEKRCSLLVKGKSPLSKLSGLLLELPLPVGHASWLH